MKNVNRLLVLSVGYILTFNAVAAPVGTPSGTDITNQAVLNFKVDNAAQTPVPSNTTTFKVDTKVNFSVSEIAPIGSTSVVPNSSGVLTFQVTNNGNYTGDFSLSAVNDAGDDFDPTSVTAYEESGVTPGYQALEDTRLYVDELTSGSSKTVYIVGAIQASTINPGSGLCTAVCDDDTAKVHLQATAAAGGSSGSAGSALVATGLTTADTAGSVDVVFADSSGTASGDIARDGKHSDDDVFEVDAVNVTVTKSTYVIWDPINCTGTASALTPSVANTKDASCGANEPKRIPGAVIHYELSIANTSSNAADELSLSDTIQAGQTYLSTSGAGTLFVDGNQEDDNTTGADDTPIDVGNPTAGSYSTGVISASILELPGGATKKIHFNVVID